MYRTRVNARYALIALLAPSVAYAEEDARIWLLDLTITTEIGLYDDSAGDPISVAPDLSLLTKGAPQIEIIHSSAALTGFHGIPLGTSFCVAGDGCGDVYHNAGLQLGYTVRSHAGGDDGLNATALSLTAGLLANNFDPYDFSLKLGVRGSYVTSGYIQFQLVPNVHIPLDDRDERDDRLFVPFTVTMVPSESVTLQLETGMATSFDNAGDNLQIPVGINLDIVGNNAVDVLLSFSFPAAYGGDGVGVTGFDARVATVGLRFSKFLGGTNE